MPVFELTDYCFTYPDMPSPALENISLTVGEGEFVLLCGASGCGKTTLLRQLKPALAPRGRRSGTILFHGTPLRGVNPHTQAAQIGFVMQSPDAQIVTDKVWHELAFGLENLGADSHTIRLRTAEMASFFGIEDWFEKDVSTLSGGQKQLLNLASVMAMQPGVLLLDEPTSQLDPIAAADFLAAVKKINSELGVAVLMIEHRLQDVFPLADRVAVMENGKIILDAPPREAGAKLIAADHPMAQALPAPLKILHAVQSGTALPLTVREGRQKISFLLQNHPIRITALPQEVPAHSRENAVSLKSCWLSYEKSGPDVIQNLTLEVPKSSFFCILGGNGTGKTTALNLIAGITKLYRGKRKINGTLAMLPQNPQSLFLMDTVRADLLEVLEGIPAAEKQRRAEEMAELVRITPLLDRHPYDLSGGEQQRAALAKVLLTEPDILLLDEPTKGLDSFFKIEFGDILKKLIRNGKTVIMVSHDIEFCAQYADFCALFFNGAVITQGDTRAFFAGNSFYTTAANRMTRGLFTNAITDEDVIALCKKNLEFD